MRYLFIPLLILLTTSASAVDPPVKLWEREYSFPGHSGCFFRDIDLTPEGDLFIAGYSTDFSWPDSIGHCAFLLDQDGELLWTVEYSCFSMFSQDGVILPDSSMAITGYCEVHPDSSRALFIMKISQEGDHEWTQVYDYPATKEEGRGITCLPDGGFAVCGRVHGTGLQQGQAWLLRTDAEGDTLWTRTWGTHVDLSTVHYGKSVLFSNNELCVLAKGTDDTLSTNGAHLLFYDLDGNYLRGTDYPDLDWDFPVSFCIPVSGGYTFVTDIHPVIKHTDQYGETLWTQSIYVTPNDWHKGYCIRTTMDSGYIFCGWDGYYEYEPDGRLVDYQEGWLARFDSEGNELWNINNTISVNHHYYSCLQLPEGGYIACGSYGVFEYMTDEPTDSRGSTGFLVRYAPETGISEPDPTGSLTLEVTPNPCSSVLSVSFAQPETGHVSVQIYNLSGRLVSTISEESFPAGNSVVEWEVPDGAPSGCYIVQLETEQECTAESIVLLR